MTTAGHTNESRYQLHTHITGYPPNISPPRFPYMLPYRSPVVRIMPPLVQYPSQSTKGLGTLAKISTMNVSFTGRGCPKLSDDRYPVWTHRVQCNRTTMIQCKHITCDPLCLTPVTLEQSFYRCRFRDDDSFTPVPRQLNLGKRLSLQARICYILSLA